MKRVIRISPDGSMSFIVTDDMSSLLALGVQSIARASNVEPELKPDGLSWYADLSPVGGPKLDGFTNRAAALAAEVDWINQHGVPTPASR